MKRNILAKCVSTWLLVVTSVPCIASQATGVPPSSVSTTSKKDRNSILAVLSSYETALNTANAEEASGLYADDAVLMPPGQEPVVGVHAIHDTYLKGSKLLRFKVKFTVVEVVPLSSEWAFARTSSAGTITILPSKTSSAEANQELFIFHKVGLAWKIARYSFSSMTSPQVQK
jgi:ketosteroid isomerase-like protein